MFSKLHSNPELKILVTGASGQLGRSLYDLAPAYPEWTFVFLSRRELDITNEEQISRVLSVEKPDVVINTAAYTNVERAEAEWPEALAANSVGVWNLTKQIGDARLIHISTDYVFRGNTNIPYKEKDKTGPTCHYGETKKRGEEAIFENTKNGVIIRTSWLYSKYGDNFLKKVIDKAKKQSSVQVICDQTGAPTAAKDLAAFILKIIPELKNTQPEVWHFTNSGSATWNEFAGEIINLIGEECEVEAVLTDQFPAIAKRPLYSVLSLQKIKDDFDIKPSEWKASLKQVILSLDDSPLDIGSC